MRQNLWPNALAKLCGAALINLIKSYRVQRIKELISQVKTFLFHVHKNVVIRGADGKIRVKCAADFY